MTGEGLYIDPASMRDLHINVRRFREHVLAKAHDGLSAFAMYIVAKAQRILQDNGNFASRALIKSGRPIEQPDGTVDAGFYMGYAAYVEYGRKAGGMPPVEDIYQWLYKKKIVPTKRERKVIPEELRKARKNNPWAKKRPKRENEYKGIEKLRYQMAWAIALSIKDNGTKAHPYLRPAYEEYRWKINKFMQQKVNEVIEQFKTK